MLEQMINFYIKYKAEIREIIDLILDVKEIILPIVIVINIKNKKRSKRKPSSKSKTSHRRRK